MLGSPAEGLLAIKAPWPSVLRGVHGDYARFEATYFEHPGFYLTGDGAKRDDDGQYWITGRADDVVIVSGHNVGTAEVESAVVLHPSVAEAAVVGVEHPVKGQVLYMFATLMDDASLPEAAEEEGAVQEAAAAKKKTREAPLIAELTALVRQHVGAFAAPDTFHFAPTGLPKTRSGKIMRRILREVQQEL